MEQLHSHLLALPSRESQEALLAFRARPDAWDACLSIVQQGHAVPDVLVLFALQTLHAIARRPTAGLPSPTPGDADACAAYVQAAASRQQALLSALVQLAVRGHGEHSGHGYADGHVNGPGHKSGLICAALAAIGVRHCSTLQQMLSAALAQLPPGFALQLLCAVAEEGESLQARAGGEVEACAEAQHALREELSPHVLSWLAALATQLQTEPELAQQQQQQHQLFQQVGQGRGQPAGGLAASAALWRGLVRCFGAWVRLGCLYAPGCQCLDPGSSDGLDSGSGIGSGGAASGVLLHALLAAAHPAGGAEECLRREACEALSDVIEYGPDPLLRALQPPVLSLAAAAAAAAAATSRTGAASSGNDVAYNITQLVSSYVTARLGEMAAQLCGTAAGAGGAGGGAGGGAAAAAAAEAAALAEALAQLAALPGWSGGGDGCPVGWPAMAALADLALACIAEAGEAAAAAAAGVASAQGGDGGGDAMQQEDGPAAAGSGAVATADANAEPPPAAATAVTEHCVPDITLGPRPGLPPQLLLLYDNVCRAVLSCCVTWSADGGGGGDGGADGVSSSDADGECEAAGLLRLPADAAEALQTCLQACAGVVGQARMLGTAAALLQHAGQQNGGGVGGEGDTDGGTPGALAAAALIAALAAVAACGRLAPPPPASIVYEQGLGAAATADAAAVLLAAAQFICRTELAPAAAAAAAAGAVSVATCGAAQHVRLPAWLRVPLWLHFCEAIAGSGGAVLMQQLTRQAADGQLQQQPQHQERMDAGRGGSADAACGALTALVEAAVAGLQAERSAATAGRALRSLLAAAASLRLPLPGRLAERLVDAAHATGFEQEAYGGGGSDGGGGASGRQAAARDVAAAALAAVRLAREESTPGCTASTAAAAPYRLRLLERLLSPALSCMAALAAVTATKPPQPQPPSGHPSPVGALPPSHDAALARCLRLLEVTLTSAVAAAAAPPPGTAGAAAPTLLDAAAEAAWLQRVFLTHAWPPLQALLHGGACGRFLPPLCRCAVALQKAEQLAWMAEAAAATATPMATAAGEGTCGFPDMQHRHGWKDGNDGGDPWVDSLLPALAGCVGRPGGKQLYEPLAMLLEGASDGGDEGTVAAAAGGADGTGMLSDAVANTATQEQEQRRRVRLRRAAMTLRAVHGLLHSGSGAALAAAWRSADSDPDTAECLLRLATAAARYALAAPPTSAYGSGAGGGGGDGALGGEEAAAAVRAEVAAGALQLAAASAGCDHRQVAAAALGCTSAVLEAACAVTLFTSAVGLDGKAVAAAVHCGLSNGALLAAVLQQGPVVAAGLLAALLSTSPLPRLQRVASALQQLGAAVAVAYRLQQFAAQSHQAPGSNGLHAPMAGEGQGGTGAAEAQAQACTQLLGSWLVAAATHQQLPQPEGASLAAAWAPLMAEAGAAAAAAACQSGTGGGSSGSTPGGGGFGASVQAQARAAQRKLRRLLREFAERRLRG